MNPHPFKISLWYDAVFIKSFTGVQLVVHNVDEVRQPVGKSSEYY
jgi:hypothetical protein